MIRRILSGLAGMVKPSETLSKLAPPAPSAELSNPLNEELFALLKRWWCESAKEDNCDYLWVHPDLIERFRALGAEMDVIQGAAYCRAVTANSSAVIFTWATGMSTILLRLPRKLQQQAITEGGRFDPTFGEDWIGFNPWREETDEALRRWFQIAYGESLKLINRR